MKEHKLMATLAEFIVAQTFNPLTLKGVEWDLHDIIYKEHKIAVK